MGRVTLADYVVGTWSEAYASQLSPKTWMHYRATSEQAHAARHSARSSSGQSGLRRSRAGRRSGSPAATAVFRSATRSTCSERSFSARSRTGRSRSNPARAVRKAPLPRRTEVRPLAPATIERMRAASSPRDATLISVLAYAGLRPGEALALQWRDVREQTILVERAISLGEEKDTKTAAHRTVRVLQPLAVDLREWRLRSGRPGENTLIFPSRAGTPWTLAAYQSWRRRAFKRAIEAAGLEHGRPYDLRHSSASLLLHEGRSVIYVARQLGHDARLTLSTYGHVMDEFEDYAAPRCADGDRRRKSGLGRGRILELTQPGKRGPPSSRRPKSRTPRGHQGGTSLSRVVLSCPPVANRNAAVAGICATL